MFFLIRSLAALAGFLRHPVTPIKTTPAPAAAETAGAMMTQPGILGLINNIVTNGSPVFGNWGLTRIGAPLAAATYTGAQLVQGLIRRELAATTTDSSDTATNIVNAIPGAIVGQTFPFLLFNAGPNSLTFAAGTGVTLFGSAVVGGLQARLFLGQVTGSAAVSFTNVFSFGGSGTSAS